MIAIGERFTALQDFFSDDTQSQYAKGLGYTVQNERLGELVERWIAEGKVELGGGAAKMAAQGVVHGDGNR